jgi:hypothetical protein
MVLCQTGLLAGSTRCRHFGSKCGGLRYFLGYFGSGDIDKGAVDDRFAPQQE